MVFVDDNKEENDTLNCEEEVFHEELKEQEIYSHHQEASSVGYIDISDFIIWSIISAIGILFCFIHAEQEHFWQWTGNTAEASQSLKAKTVVSVISTIIGGCVVAILMKTIVAVSFTTIKYRGAHFSQLVTMIGGYSPSHIPMLLAGGGWFSILVIILVLAVSVVTKQLAVISMGVQYEASNETMWSYTPDYTTCNAVSGSSKMSEVLPVLVLNTINSGSSTFERVLPFTTVSCLALPDIKNFTRSAPVTNQTPFDSTITIKIHEESETERQWINCTVIAGHAIAITTCNNTNCQTQRTSEITPYTAVGSLNGIPRILIMAFKMLTSPTSYVRNPIDAWILGGNFSHTYYATNAMPGESIEIIKSRTEILGTVAIRILCDYNDGNTLNSTTPIISRYQDQGYYVYRILWKWPFRLIAGFIFLTWFVCMVALWMTPESRVMSVEWFISQYISKNHLGYLSGRSLVQAHKGSIFQVVDQNPDGKIGNIVVSQMGVHRDLGNDRIIHRKQYQ